MNFLILLSILPGIIIGSMIYKADRKEKEPKKELLKAFLWGIVSIFLTLFLSFIFGIMDIQFDSKDWVEVLWYSFICISLIEEASKWICTQLFLANNKNYDYLFDGIVYATFVSLGFATVENILYTLNGGVVTGLFRAITTVPAHAFFGVFSGYYLSLSKKEKINSNKKTGTFYFICSLLLPFLLHGFYDFCLLTKNMIFLCIYLIFVVALYIFSIYHIKKLEAIDMPLFKRKANFCGNCGSKIVGYYCGNCGKKVEEES